MIQICHSGFAAETDMETLVKSTFYKKINEATDYHIDALSGTRRCGNGFARVARGA